MFLLTRQSKKTAIEGLLLGRDSAWVELSVLTTLVIEYLVQLSPRHLGDFVLGLAPRFVWE
jgi:hypothetical protein